MEANLRLVEACVGRGDMAEIQCAAVSSSVALGRRNSVAHKLDTALGITALGQQRSLNETRPVLGTCEPMLNTECYRFICVSCGQSRIATYSSEERAEA